MSWCNITVLMCTGNLFLWLTGLYVNRMVNTCLAEEMKEIHAFEQKTLTPEQWDKQNAQWHPHYFHLNKWCISDMEHGYKLNSSGNHHAVDHSVDMIKLLYDVFWRLFEYFLSQKVDMSAILAETILEYNWNNRMLLCMSVQQKRVLLEQFYIFLNEYLFYCVCVYYINTLLSSWNGKKTQIYCLNFLHSLITDGTFRTSSLWFKQILVNKYLSNTVCVCWGYLFQNVWHKSP